MKELIEFIEQMEAPVNPDHEIGSTGPACAYCEVEPPSLETQEDEDSWLNTPENHGSECPYRRLKELAAEAKSKYLVITSDDPEAKASNLEYLKTTETALQRGMSESDDEFRKRIKEFHKIS